MYVAPYPLWSPEPDAGLLASRAADTGELIFPAFPDASPLAARHAPVALPSIGEVYSFTVIHPAAKSGLAPYALGYVDLPGPVRIFGRLQGKARPAIGERYRAVPDEQFGYVFEAVEGASA
ncbi:OB-fold domain-containing protein [Variovorax sp. LjRoot290]|uniref:Zn-ribbon domain-containing OB-fold protein n=1 Tax=unclassified Variovorax TaxID=663243 RepID=UPI003ECD66A1